MMLAERRAVLDMRSMEEGKKRRKGEGEGESVRREVGRRRVSGSRPAATASALSISGGRSVWRRKKYAQDGGSLAAASRYLIAAAAPGGCDREPDGLRDAARRSAARARRLNHDVQKMHDDA